MKSIVIIGGSVAGTQTARSLRANGFEGKLTIVEAENEWPYDKPPLSKGYLLGNEAGSSLSLLTQSEASDLDVEVILGARAIQLDLESSRVHLSGEQALTYDYLVIATGGRARPSPWGDQPGIHVLRTAEDARALGSEFSTGGTVAIVGAGFIGAEVAATARTKGLEVILIDPMETPMSRVMPATVGNWMTQLHNHHGVRTVFGTGVKDIAGEQGNFTITLSDGKEHKAQTVLVGIGSIPNVEWLENSGLVVKGGILADEFLIAEGTTNVYVAGDVARAPRLDNTEPLRVEHWTNAIEQANTVAHNILNPDAAKPCKAVDYIWSDQYDWKIQIAGAPSSEMEYTAIGDPFDDGRAAVVFSDHEVLKGVVTFNWPRAMLQTRKALSNQSTSKDDMIAALEKMRHTASLSKP